MAAASITGFWAVSVLLSLTPGADWAYAISAGLRHRTVVPAVAGMVGGHALHVAIVAGGVAALVARFPTALTAITLIGAAYLIWLGTLTLLRRYAVRMAGPEAMASRCPTRPQEHTMPAASSDGMCP